MSNSVNSGTHGNERLWAVGSKVGSKDSEHDQLVFEVVFRHLFDYSVDFFFDKRCLFIERPSDYRLFCT